MQIVLVSFDAGVAKVLINRPDKKSVAIWDRGFSRLKKQLEILINCRLSIKFDFDAKNLSFNYKNIKTISR